MTNKEKITKAVAKMIQLAIKAGEKKQIAKGSSCNKKGCCR